MIESLELLREFPDQLQVLCGENGVPVELNADSQDHTAAEEIGGFLEGKGLGVILRDKIHHIIIQLRLWKLNCKKYSYSQDEYDVKPRVAVNFLHYAALLFQSFYSYLFTEANREKLSTYARSIHSICNGHSWPGSPAWWKPAA